MSVVYWDGSTDTDWATAANWTAAATPNADDEVVFDSRQVTKPTTGMSDGGSEDDSGHADNATLDLLHFKLGYTGGIGTAALPLVTSPDKIIIEGTGTYHICCGITSQSTDATIATTIINNKDAIVYLYSNANDGANTCTFTDVIVVAGTLHKGYYEGDTEKQGVYVANLYVNPKNRRSSNVTVTIAKDCYKVIGTVATNIYMSNGTLSTDSMAAIIHMDNGTLNYGTDLAASPETDLNIAELRMNGGTFNWYPDDSGDAATIAELVLVGGSFVASAATNNNRTKIITKAYVFDGASMNLKNDMGNITLTTLYNHGGTITMDSGAKVAVTYNQPEA